MRHVKNLAPALLLLILAAFVFSCGGGETTGTPGSGGEWNPIIVSAAGFYCTEEGIEQPGPNEDVDAFYRPDIDCDPNTPPIEPEFFGDHRLRVAMFNADIPGRPGSARTVTLNKVELQYRRSEGYPPGAPVLQSRTVNFIHAIPPSTEEQTLDVNNATVFFVTLVPVATKDEYRAQYESGERVPPDFPTEYEVVVKMSGTDIFDDNLSVTFSVPIRIGDWDYCKCAQ
jgi:hypothetical protein